MKMFTGCGERALLSAWKIIKSLLIGMRSKIIDIIITIRHHLRIRLHFTIIKIIKIKSQIITRSTFRLHGFERETTELGNRNLTAELGNVILGISRACVVSLQNSADRRARRP